MYYITVNQGPMYHQMTLEEFLLGTNKNMAFPYRSNHSNTRTYACEKISHTIINSIDTQKLISKLETFNNVHKDLFEKNRKDLYREFYIPKRSGGLRKIDAPLPDLMCALRELKLIFEQDFNALYHTSAFAYIKDRSAIKAIDRHVNNKSEWYGKLDLSNFFGSTTKDFVMSMLKTIFPFCLVCQSNDGKEALEKALSLAFLDGGLPQGTPISPMITNLIMIPIDYELSNVLRNYNHQRYVYTRYADDFQISSRYSFNINEITNLLDETLSKFNAPFKINRSKTRYGSASGRNWNLGVMVTKDKNGDIKKTIGHKKEHQFSAMLNSYVLDSKNNKTWDLSDVRVLDGYMNYYIMVEGDAIKRLVEHVGKKHNVNIPEMIKSQLRS